MKFQCENESCKKDIYIEENITCSNCKQIQKKKLTIKPLFIGTFITSIAGGFSGYKISNITHSSERYPVKSEFSIIDYYINGDNTFHNIKNIKVKKDIFIQVYTEFEHSLSIIGWHFKRFCFYYYQDVINDSYDDEIESNRFYEKQKKKKQRKTHSLNELLSFISYITKQPDLKKRD